MNTDAYLFGNIIIRMSAFVLALALLPRAFAEQIRHDSDSLAARCHSTQAGGALQKALGKGTAPRPNQPHDWSLLADPEFLAGQGNRAAFALRREFGLDARCIKVILLGYDELQSRARAPGFHSPGFP